MLPLVVASQKTFDDGLRQMVNNHEEEQQVSSEQSRSSAGVTIPLETLDGMLLFVDQTRLIAFSDRKLYCPKTNDFWEVLKECKFNVNSFALVKV